MKKSYHNNLRWVVQLFLTILIIGLIVIWVRPERIISTIRGADSLLILAACLFTPVVIGIKSIRWWLLARSVDGSITFGLGLRSYLAGLALAIVTPSAVGEIGRGFFVPGASGGELTGKVILDKGVDLSAVAIFGAIGLLLFGGNELAWFGVVLVVGLVGGWALFWWLASRKQIRRINRLVPIVAAISVTGKGQILTNILLALVGFTVFYLQAFVLLNSVWADVPWQVITTFPIITLSTLLPVTIGGTGVREWTAVLLLNQFSIPSEVAFATFFGHFVIVQLGPSLLGAGFIAAHLSTSRQRSEKGI